MVAPNETRNSFAIWRLHYVQIHQKSASFVCHNAYYSAQLVRLLWHDSWHEWEAHIFSLAMF